MAVPILTTLIVFASVFGIVYVVITARNRERLALIEKGADASIFRKDKDPNSGKYTTLMFGILLIGLALGVLAGALLEETAYLPVSVPYFVMIMLFGGMALLVYYSILNKLKEKEKRKTGNSH